MRTVIGHMTDVMLTEEQLAFFKVLYDNYKVNLSTFDEYVANQVKKLADTIKQSIVPHVLRCGLFVNKHNVAPLVGQVPPPADYLDSRMQALESGLRRVDQGVLVRHLLCLPPRRLRIILACPHLEVSPSSLHPPSLHPGDFQTPGAQETWVQPPPVFRLMRSSSSYHDLLQWKRS